MGGFDQEALEAVLALHSGVTAVIMPYNLFRRLTAVAINSGKQPSNGFYSDCAHARILTGSLGSFNDVPLLTDDFLAPSERFLKGDLILFKGEVSDSEFVLKSAKEGLNSIRYTVGGELKRRGFQIELLRR